MSDQALVDPVCFLTCYPQLLYNFIYKVPSLADALGSLPSLVAAARFLFSRDLIIAEVSTCPHSSLPLSEAISGLPIDLHCKIHMQ